MTAPMDIQEAAKALRAYSGVKRMGWNGSQLLKAIDAAIDRPIVLDNAPPPPPRHPREIALRQDAARGNFRYQQEDDGA